MRVRAADETRGAFADLARKSCTKGDVQGLLHCRCGRDTIVANGLCATCYTLRRQDADYFGGLRESVLARDGYCCRVCSATGRGKNAITVHHRVPGRSQLPLMIALCPACHAKVHRTHAVLTEMPALLLELWREQHPEGHEQTTFDFQTRRSQATPLPLFVNTASVAPGDRDEHERFTRP